MEKPSPPEESSGAPPTASPASPPPPAGPAGPRASRLTTIVLIVSLVLVVLTAGVLGTVAVLMTRNPDSPLFGGKPLTRLGQPIYFAPVEDQKAAPCPGEKVALSLDRTVCYFLSDAVAVSAVQAIETVKEKDGYGVRIAVAPAFRDALAALLKERVDQQIAIMVGQNESATVLAAPTVAQTMSGDSLSIAGFTKEKADELVRAMLGASGPSSPTPSSPATEPGTGTTQPGTGTTQPGTGTTQPGTGTTPGSGATPPGTGATPPGTGTGTTGTGTGAERGSGAPTGGTQSTGSSLSAGGERKYADCAQAKAAGYGGPYQKGRHPQYHWYADKDRDGFACDPQDG
ncbi:excalibur calcium-binding domain-containing protein [Nonomuraea roseola]|uniref:Excalibur calcium-binding domain-containing protein n=1 Tax=Nonomuraea roseola TaxID=46179 RepID=A0ABV5Q9Z0_9ACTN